MQAITANHLTGGHVLFFATGGGWSKDISDAALYSDADSLASALALASKDEEAGHIVAVYEIDIIFEDDAPVPKKLRERIRAEGPTIPYGAEMKLEGFYAA
ncbi:MAG: DUF2849 domain-containing protein [Hyphomicrobiales bacterium]